VHVGSNLFMEIISIAPITVEQIYVLIIANQLMDNVVGFGGLHANVSIQRNANLVKFELFFC